MLGRNSLAKVCFAYAVAAADDVNGRVVSRHRLGCACPKRVLIKDKVRFGEPLKPTQLLGITFDGYPTFWLVSCSPELTNGDGAAGD